MVGIVIVSHSWKVAEGVKDLASQMGVPGQKIVCAGGMEDCEIGTDAVKISQAVLEAEHGDGVVVLVDLGSAVLSTNMAFELLEDSLDLSKVKIADAPILEGAIGAVIQASIGSDINEVIAAAESARGMCKL